MEYKKYHGRYPNWDYKAVSTKIKEDKTKEVIYYTLKDNNKKSEGVEVYFGSNYIADSTDRSYPQNYILSKVPKKYREIVDLLKKKHKTIKWSKKEYVHYN